MVADENGAIVVFIDPLPVALDDGRLRLEDDEVGPERGEAAVNYVMGAAFITEGAIPFAAADPWRVIVSCIGGSAVAGLLTGLFKCQLLAPHGGVFVFATIQPLYTIPLYLLSVVVGSLVTAILLGILKKDHPTPDLGKWKGIRFGKKKQSDQYYKGV